ncbi:nicastrin [Mobula birostris]|uniref:nicastrin n=1 Tax=Mobula birostris TaxID=1983395 RepID=UPI003B27FEAE
MGMEVAVGSIWAALLVGLCCANSVERKIYINLNATAPCVRLMNATHQIGCQSSLGGNTGVIHLVEHNSNLSWVLSDGPNPPYMVVLESVMFTRDVMLKLKQSSRVSGVAAVLPPSSAPGHFSLDVKCPNDGFGVYSKDYGPEYAHCNGTAWNPDGSGLSYEDFPFPVFMLKDKNETQVIRECYKEHNRPRGGAAPQFPLCAMQLSAHMHGVRDTVTCMRRTAQPFSVTLGNDGVCDPLEDYNIWMTIQPINKSGSASPEDRFVVAAARLDSRSFFWEVAPGSDSAISGFTVLLAAAEALARIPDVKSLTKNIMLLFFQGETFDYIGSSRMVYDMIQGKFPIRLENIDSFLELNQIGIGTASKIWAHTDPVSLRNSTVHEQVRKLLRSLLESKMGLNISVQQPNQSQPLPPSSFQRFLRARNIPGAVLTDHQGSFTNRYYQSVYDLAENIGLRYPDGLTPEEALNHITDTAKSLADVATLVVRTLYLQAGGNGSLENITADPQTVTRMLYGFIINWNNSWFQSIISQDKKDLFKKQDHISYYVSVNEPTFSTWLVQFVLTNLTGYVTNFTEEECRHADPKAEFFDYVWVQGWRAENASEPTPRCVRTHVWLKRARSPAFELHDWASTEYSTWTESRWQKIGARIFLVASRELEIITLVTGVAVLLVSMVLIYFLNAKSNVLFSGPREQSSVTY